MISARIEKMAGGFQLFFLGFNYPLLRLLITSCKVYFFSAPLAVLLLSTLLGPMYNIATKKTTIATSSSYQQRECAAVRVESCCAYARPVRVFVFCRSDTTCIITNQQWPMPSSSFFVAKVPL